MDPSDFERNLEKYAEVAVRVGLNLQPGQRLLIGATTSGIGGAPVELAPLVRLITKKAYQAGAHFVDVMWTDEEIKLIRFQYAPRDSFDETTTWPFENAVKYGRNGDAFLNIYADDPDLLKGQDPELVSKVQRINFQNGAPVSDLIERSVMNWLVISAPTARWTAKLFPDLSPEERLAKFWEVIFRIARITGDDPVADWREHIKGLAARSDYLNHKHYSALKYTGPGTDLTVGLPAEHIWHSGQLTAQNGISFTANIPTEEVFTMPHKDRVDGVVRATKPLSVGGALTEHFSLTFSEGRVVQVAAEKGEEHLWKLIDTDEGARRLGEVALVPHSSPISQSGLLFYNILFDENASSHLALGAAYKFTMQGGEAMTNEAYAAAGGNDSLIHVDFMVGSGELDIDGIRPDGTPEPIMRGGEWAFEV